MRGAVAAMGLVLAGWPLAAVGQTVISPDVGAARGLGTTVGQAGVTYTIAGGTRAGGNLFHSFSQFDLGAGDTARWVGGGDVAAVNNVINRVTGGQASRINGTIDSTALPNATFYFVNPAGIVFGPGAQVNVPSVAHFSTAGELRFANGDRFAIATPNGSTLSVATPEAWGFVGGQGDITVSDVGAAFAAGEKPLSFSAANIAFTNANFSVAGLDLTAVGAAAATVSLSDPLVGAHTGAIQFGNSALVAANANTPVGSFRLNGGSINFDNARLTTDTAGAAAGADIRIKGSAVRLGANSLFVTSSRGTGRGGQVQVSAGDLVIDGTGSTTFVAGIASVATVAGPAGQVSLTADNVRLQGGAFVGSNVGGAADAGDIQITAKNLVIDTAIINTANLPGSTGRGSSIRLRANAFDLGAATITTQGFGAGRAGDVVLEGGSLVMSGGSMGSTPGGRSDSGNVSINLTGRFEAEGAFIGVSTFNDFGDTVAAGAITIRSSELVMVQSNLFTQASGLGAPGRVTIDTGNAIFDDFTFVGDAKDGAGALPGLFQLNATGDVFMRTSFLRSNANGAADGGVIEVRGRNIELESSLIQTDTISLGDAGRVFVKATGDLTMDAGTFVTSNTGGEGRAGDVRAEARNISLNFGSALRSDALSGSTGAAGEVIVSADTLSMRDSSISSDSRNGARGDAGTVNIDVDRLTVLRGGTISSTTSSPGRAGSVVVNADEILLDGEGFEATAIASESNLGGEGGSVAIVARKLTLDRTAVVSTISQGESDAGDIRIVVDELLLLNNSGIAAIAAGEGRSGDIEISANNLEVRSSGEFLPSAITSAGFGGGGGNISLNVRSLLVDYGQISSDTLLVGNAGDVRIKADSIVLKNLGAISSSTQGFDNAGSIDIQAKSLVMDEGTLIISAATGVSDGGNAGSVAIRADDVVVGKGASITTSTLSLGDAGLVDITAKRLQVNGGDISSSADAGSTGAARDVRITATESLRVENGGAISTYSDNPKQAGRIEITAGTLLVDGELSIISSENGAGMPKPGGQPGPGGDAGSIRVSTDNLTISNGGRVSTNSFAGAAGDINIAIKRPGLFVLEGAEAPGVIQTSSGPGTGGAITIVDPLAIISNGGLILALGQQRGANVQIQSRYFINSTDRQNVVDVDGDFRLQTGLYDVSSGTVSRDLSVLDASKVLRGQCPAARSTGAVSQLITRPVGPYAREAQPAAPSQPAETPVGGCR